MILGINYIYFQHKFCSYFIDGSDMIESIYEYTCLLLNIKQFTVLITSHDDLFYPLSLF